MASCQDHRKAQCHNERAVGPPVHGHLRLTRLAPSGDILAKWGKDVKREGWTHAFLSRERPETRFGKRASTTMCEKSRTCRKNDLVIIYFHSDPVVVRKLRI